MKKYFFLWPILIVLIFSILAGWSLLKPGLLPTHDGEYHVVRFYEFDKTLRDGNLFPRWAPDLNHGYGVPLFNYVYPLPNYFASLVHLLGFSFIDAFKLNMFLACLVGGLFFYLWSRQFWGNLGGVVSSIFYTFSPYHFVDIYIRGSVGEVWALAFFPAFLWAITKLLEKENKKHIILAGIFLAAIILSHNILAIMFFSFIIFYLGLLFYLAKDKKSLLISSLSSLLFGLSLSAIFWLPALLEKQYVEGLLVFNIKETFPEIYQFLFPSWGSGFANGNLGNQMSFQIGVANLFTVFVSFLLLPYYFKKRSKNATIVAFFLGLFLIIFFLMNKFSLSVWEKVPLMNYFQFPWRFLSIEILITSFLAGNILNIWRSKTLAILLILFVFLLGIGYTKPAYYLLREDSYYFTRPNFTEGTNSPGNIFNTIWFNRSLEKRKEKIQFEKGSGKIKMENIKSTKYHFKISLIEDSELNVNTAYFPGWTAFIDGNKIETKPNKDGLISFFTFKGDHDVEVEFIDTLVREVAKIVSLVSIFSLLVLNYLAKIRR